MLGHFSEVTNSEAATNHLLSKAHTIQQQSVHSTQHTLVVHVFNVLQRSE